MGFFAPATFAQNDSKNAYFRHSERSEESHSTPAQCSSYLRDATPDAPRLAGPKPQENPSALWSSRRQGQKRRAVFCAPGAKAKESRCAAR